MSNHKNVPYRIYLPEHRIPKQWYNIRADLKEQPAPMLNPGTLQPLKEEELYPVFCEKLAKQEMNDTDRYIDIPQGILDFYRMYRPSPLIRAYCLEQELDTPAKIYYKFEGNNTSGSHKLNSAIPQVYFAKEQGITALTTETGAGQWGTALAMACAYYHMPLTVYMVKTSYQQKPYRKNIIETFGAKIIPSPSDTTNAGRAILERFPGTGGSLGCAISEAVETAVTTPNTRYVLGSVLNHVLLHQSVVRLEAKEAMEMYGEYPDMVIGCAGGGSNFGGLIAPFLRDRIEGKRDTRFIAVEPASCPSFTRGRYAYDFGDTGKMTPLIKMCTLGSDFLPSPNHAGGLRYHGMNSVLSKLHVDGIVEAEAVEQTAVFETAVRFSRCEGLLPAPESSHAIYTAVQEALKCKETGEEKTILFGLTGTGYFDMAAYDAYLSGKMTDYIPTEEDLQKGFDGLPVV
ncbi:MAG TPA: TrpB-like pyridoxal phosphate-dependent enzyme [Clostridiales bacterium]|nr:TrpB-like pyridoxal phosphate-dependent enzyme [Clostridiales bacterium]